MKKIIFTLNIEGYSPAITAMTFPYIQKYADKIGAEFKVITERKFPDMPVTYEKLQIHELAVGYDWVIYIDADALIHPDMFDITDFISKDTVLHTRNDLAGNRFTCDKYFKRDGRSIGSCNWFTVASDLCLDLWKPLDDLTLEQALANIHPIQAELNIGAKAEHFIDDYILSRNISKYGLKFKSMATILDEQKHGQIVEGYLAHQHLITEAEKETFIRATIAKWRIQ